MAKPKLRIELLYHPLQKLIPITSNFIIGRCTTSLSLTNHKSLSRNQLNVNPFTLTITKIGKSVSTLNSMDMLQGQEIKVRNGDVVEIMKGSGLDIKIIIDEDVVWESESDYIIGSGLDIPIDADGLPQDQKDIVKIEDIGDGDLNLRLKKHHKGNSNVQNKEEKVRKKPKNKITTKTFPKKQKQEEEDISEDSELSSLVKRTNRSRKRKIVVVSSSSGTEDLTLLPESQFKTETLIDNVKEKQEELVSSGTESLDLNYHKQIPISQIETQLDTQPLLSQNINYCSSKIGEEGMESDVSDTLL